MERKKEYEVMKFTKKYLIGIGFSSALLFSAYIIDFTWLTQYYQVNMYCTIVKNNTGNLLMLITALTVLHFVAKKRFEKEINRNNIERSD